MIEQVAEFSQAVLNRMSKPYSGDIILQRANAFTSKRYGISLSARQLRRWVYLGLVPGPEAHGQRRGAPPQWLWSPLGYRRILQVCRMRKRGFKRTSAIIFNLWMGGTAYPFLAVRRAAAEEFRRLRKAVARSVPTAWDPRVEGEALTSRSRAAVLKGLGSEEAVFPTLSPEAVLRFAGTMLFGVELDQDSIFALFPLYGVPKTLIEEWKRQDPASSDLELGMRTFAGLAADPEDCEMSAEATLEETDEETFTNIRDFVRVAPWMYGMVPVVVSMMYSQTDNVGTTLRDGLTKVSRMLHDPSFRLLHFVLMVRRAQLKGDHGRGARAFARSVVRPLQQLMMFVASDKETQALLQEVVSYLGIEQQTPLVAALPMLAAKATDPVLRALARKLIRITRRHGLSDLLKLRKPVHAG